jgi:predicted transcriptional regulator
MDRESYNSIPLKQWRLELMKKDAKMFTLKGVAFSLGVSRMTIYRAETGKGVSSKMLKRLCEHYGRDWRDIVR